MAARVQLWMVEQRWEVPIVGSFPVRSVVEARSRREAAKGAANAIVEAVSNLLGGKVRGSAIGVPVVLYPIADGPMAKR